MLPNEAERQRIRRKYNRLVRVAGGIRAEVAASREALAQMHPDWALGNEDVPRWFDALDIRLDYLRAAESMLVGLQWSWGAAQDWLAGEHVWAGLESEKRGSGPGVVDEWAQIQRFGFYMALITLTEETFRAIVRSGKVAGILPAALNPHGPIFNIWNELTTVSRNRSLRPLYGILFRARNMVHNNGRYMPPGTPRRIVQQYQGRRFGFSPGRSANWVNDEFLLWTAKQLVDAHVKIVSSRKIGGLDYCPRGIRFAGKRRPRGISATQISV